MAGMNSFFSGMSRGFDKGNDQVMAMQRALLAAGEIGLQTDPIMKEKLQPGMVKRAGKVYRSASPVAGGGEALGQEVPTSEYMIPTGKNKYTFGPNPLNKLLREAELNNALARPSDQAADFATKYATGSVGQYGALSNPQAYDDAFNKGYAFYTKLSGLRGLAGKDAAIDTTAVQAPASSGYDPKTGDAVGSFVAPNIDSEVEALVSLPPDKQEFVVQQLMASQDPLDQAIIAGLQKRKQSMMSAQPAAATAAPLNVPGVRSRSEDVFAGTPWPGGY